MKLKWFLIVVPYRTTFRDQRNNMADKVSHNKMRRHVGPSINKYKPTYLFLSRKYHLHSRTPARAHTHTQAHTQAHTHTQYDYTHTQAHLHMPHTHTYMCMYKCIRILDYKSAYETNCDRLSSRPTGKQLRHYNRHARNNLLGYCVIGSS